MPFAIILALQAASPSATIATFDLAGVAPPTSITPSAGGCAATDDVTVCGRRANRHRLPLPAERQPSAPASHAPADGMAALTPAAPGGLFAGQRQCSKKEALA